jgi:DNA ligase (NAD+)
MLKVGSTRGDGRIGEDVTANLKTIEAIPLSIDDEDLKENLKKEGLENLYGPIKNALNGEIVIRGEVFMSKKEFKRVNEEQAEKGLKIYANPRNFAAGSVRQLNPSLTRSRKLDSFAYSLVTDVGQKTHEQEHQILKVLGFKTNSHNELKKDLKGVREFRDYWEKHRGSLNYEIDGVVVFINDNRMFEKLGVIGKAPRGGIAYKFTPNEAKTEVEDIVVQVGRTGILTPVAKLKPVKIGGVTVSRATLHNLDEIKRLDVKIGDTVIVSRAGDVIPDITAVIGELRTGGEKTFSMPKRCPACGEAIRKIDGQVAYKCVNKNCPAIRREAIYHLVSRRAFDIDGVGPKIIDSLMEAALIKDAADIFNLKKDDFLNLERFADKSAQNAVESIEAKKTVPLDRFIYSLGIDHVGEETAFTLAKRFSKLENLMGSDYESLEKIPDVGPVVAKSISDWFARKYNRNLISKFRKFGVKILEEKKNKDSARLAGKTFVLTGTLENMSRDTAKDRIRELGGDVSSSVSKETDYVVTGAEPGSKFDKAQKLGVKILQEKEFLSMIR